MTSRHSNGPSTVPFDIPLLTGMLSEAAPSFYTCCAVTKECLKPSVNTAFYTIVFLTGTCWDAI